MHYLSYISVTYLIYIFLSINALVNCNDLNENKIYIFFKFIILAISKSQTYNFIIIN